jgi:hypothetical protein
MGSTKATRRAGKIEDARARAKDSDCGQDHDHWVEGAYLEKEGSQDIRCAGGSGQPKNTTDSSEFETGHEDEPHNAGALRTAPHEEFLIARECGPSGGLAFGDVYFVIDGLRAPAVSLSDSHSPQVP